MQLRDLTPFGIALLAFGCSRPPKAVFVDLDRLVREDVPVAAEMEEPPNPKTVSIPTQTAHLPRASGTLILDLAGTKIELARKLILEDRNRAIRTLSRRLATVRSEEVEVEKLKALEDLKERQAAYMASVFDQLYQIFQAYAKERGPSYARADYLQYRRPDLYISRLRPTDFAQKQHAEMMALRKIVAEMDDRYNQQATKILDEAQVRLSAELGSIQAKFETLRANAIEQADRDAKAAIERAASASNLNLGQNKSVIVSMAKAESVRIDGSSQPSIPSSGLSTDPVISLAERRKSLEQQLEIWLRTRGYARTQVRSDGSDATEEFDVWRKSHRVGH